MIIIIGYLKTDSNILSLFILFPLLRKVVSCSTLNV